MKTKMGLKSNQLAFNTVKIIEEGSVKVNIVKRWWKKNKGKNTGGRLC